MKKLVPVQDSHLFIVDNEGILYLDSAQEIHYFNTSATFIWCLLQENHNYPSILQELSSTFNLSPENAAVFLQSALNSWEISGLVSQDGIPIKKTDWHHIPSWSTDQSLPELAPETRFAFTEYLSVLNSRIMVRMSDTTIADRVMPLFKHCRTHNHRSHDVVISILRLRDQFILYRDLKPVYTCKKLIEVAPLAKSLVWSTAIDLYSFFIDIHAGAVGGKEGCAIFPAPAGSGKSTLTMAMVANGYELLSDEMAVLEKGTLNVVAAPLALCVKTTGIGALKDLFPELTKLTVHLRADGKKAVYLPPHPEWLPHHSGSKPVKVIIFPRYKEGASTRLQSLNKLEAIRKLLEQCVVVSERLTAESVSVLITKVLGTGCYDLSYSDLEDGVRAVSGLLRKSGISKPAPHDDISVD